MGGIVSTRKSHKYALQIRSISAQYTPNNQPAQDGIGSPSELPTFVVSNKISKASAKLLKIKSAANLHKIIPMVSDVEAVPKKPKIRVSRSTNSLQQLVKSQHKPVIVCSESHPWLIKKTNHFENSSLNEYEFGRVLGEFNQISVLNLTH